MKFESTCIKIDLRKYIQNAILLWSHNAKQLADYDFITAWSLVANFFVILPS